MTDTGTEAASQQTKLGLMVQQYLSVVAALLGVIDAGKLERDGPAIRGASIRHLFEEVEERGLSSSALGRV